MMKLKTKKLIAKEQDEVEVDISELEGDKY